MREPKRPYSLRVSRGAEVIGEYRFRATAAGLKQLIERIKPEFSYDILGDRGIVHAHVSTQQ